MSVSTSPITSAISSTPYVVATNIPFDSWQGGYVVLFKNQSVPGGVPLATALLGPGPLVATFGVAADVASTKEALVGADLKSLLPPDKEFL